MSIKWFLLFCFNIIVSTSAFHKLKEWKDFWFPEKYTETPKFCLCKCGISNEIILKSHIRQKRLYGGEDIVPHQFPWLAVIHVENETIGGSLISDKHVLTAASTLYGKPPAAITVSLGIHDRCNIHRDPGINISVASVNIHPSYSASNLNHDIALLKLRHSVTFGKFISPICLPMYPKFKEFDQVAWTVAWDSSSHNSTSCTPKAVSLPILSPATCSKVSSSQYYTPDKGCLGPLGTNKIICKTDEGFPVMTRWFSKAAYKLVGVISSLSSCENNTTPIFTKVIDNSAWIHDNIKNDCLCKF